MVLRGEHDRRCDQASLVPFSPVSVSPQPFIATGVYVRSLVHLTMSGGKVRPSDVHFPQRRTAL